MCSNYIPARPASLEKHFGVPAPATETKPEAFPGYLAPIIRLRHAEDDERETEAHGQPECVPAMFGMVPG